MVVEVVRPGNERFSRLLQLLGEWYEKSGKILIFLKSPHTCDAFRRDLLEHGYPSLLLHGDKMSNLSDINICNLVIATPIHSAQGLEDFQLVINYDDSSSCYVEYARKVSHAASNGCAVTFLSTEEGRYAPHLLKALKLSNQAVPDDLIDLADALKARIKEMANPLKPEFKRIYEKYLLEIPPPAHLLLN